MYPDAPLIQRQGEVDAWDNADFREAIRAANKSQIIVAGIVTDVCESCRAIPKSLLPPRFGSSHTCTLGSRPPRYDLPRPLPPCRGLQRLGQRGSLRDYDLADPRCLQ